LQLSDSPQQDGAFQFLAVGQMVGGEEQSKIGASRGRASQILNIPADHERGVLVKCVAELAPAGQAGAELTTW